MPSPGPASGRRPASPRRTQVSATPVTPTKNSGVYPCVVTDLDPCSVAQHEDEWQPALSPLELAQVRVQRGVVDIRLLEPGPGHLVGIYICQSVSCNLGRIYGFLLSKGLKITWHFGSAPLGFSACTSLIKPGAITLVSGSKSMSRLKTNSKYLRDSTRQGAEQLG